MRNRIFGGIGTLWGGAVLFNTFFGETPAGSGAYATGQFMAVAFGFLLLCSGGYYLVKG